jgi:hypothetical protein
MEFGVATLPPGVADPEPENPRQVYGIADLEDNHQYHDNNRGFKAHVAKTLTRAGLPANLYSQSWHVGLTRDLGVPDREKQPYRYYTLFVTSPIMQFKPIALDSVSKACKLLEDNYRIMDPKLALGYYNSRANAPAFRIFVRNAAKTFLYTHSRTCWPSSGPLRSSLTPFIRLT